MALKIDFKKFYKSLIEELEEEQKVCARTKNWDKYYKLKARIATEKENLRRINERTKNE